MPLKERSGKPLREFININYKLEYSYTFYHRRNQFNSIDIYQVSFDYQFQILKKIKKVLAKSPGLAYNNTCVRDDG